MSYSIADHLSGRGLDITMQLLWRERLAIELTVTLLTHGQPVIIITFCNYLFKIVPDRGHFSCNFNQSLPQGSDKTIASWCSNPYPQIPCGIGNAWVCPEQPSLSSLARQTHSSEPCAGVEESVAEVHGDDPCSSFAPAETHQHHCMDVEIHM